MKQSQLLREHADSFLLHIILWRRGYIELGFYMEGFDARGDGTGRVSEAGEEVDSTWRIVVA